MKRTAKTTTNMTAWQSFKREYFSVVTDYKPVVVEIKGQQYIYNKPVYRTLTDKAIAKLMLQGVVMALGIWGMLVASLIIFPLQ